MIHENFHTKHSVFTAPDAHADADACSHAYITQLYIMSIQPVNKAAEHLINSTPVLEKERGGSKKKQSILIL